MTHPLHRGLTWGAALWLLSGSWAAAQKPQTAARAARGAKAPAAALPPVADVNLDVLHPPATEPPKVTRNPFRFYEPPAPPPPKAVKAPEPTFVAPPVPTGPPPPPPIISTHAPA